MGCLSDWERFVHAETPSIPPLVKAGLLHVQFETIHPFLDGNGRLGRLLITLFLCAEGVLRQPLLYLSLYFKTHRAIYYRLLQEVRERSAWEAWLEFFLDGIAETADQAFETANRIAGLLARDRERIIAEADRTASVLQLHDLMRTRPFLTATAAVQQTGLTMPTVNAALAQLQALELVEEVTGRRRGRVFAYRAYLDILSEGAGL
jgi:Fic family protein